MCVGRSTLFQSYQIFNSSFSWPEHTNQTGKVIFSHHNVWYCCNFTHQCEEHFKEANFNVDLSKPPYGSRYTYQSFTHPDQT